MFSTMRGTISIAGDTISAIENIQYCGRCSVLWVDDVSSVLWGITSIHLKMFSTMRGYIHFFGGIKSVILEDV